MKSLLTALIAGCLTPAYGQAEVAIHNIATPTFRSEIALNTKSTTKLPEETWFSAEGNRLVRNVSSPTLIPVLPSEKQATGAAVILLPGGAFSMLSMDTEGWSVANKLAKEGIAVFVLKYRLNATPPDMEGFKSFIRDNIAKSMTGGLHLNTPRESLQDAEEAFRFVRTNANQWRIDPSRLGLIGFSAGAQLALDLTCKANAESMPAFIATIYGPMKAVTVPIAAPPIFVAYAADDALFGNQGMGLIESWRTSGKTFELHVYQRGGHGFGLGVKNTTTLDWSSSLIHWLSMNRFL